jgi:hypothetical protein
VIADLMILGKGGSASWRDAWIESAPEAETWTINDVVLEGAARHFDVHEDRRFWDQHGKVRCPWVVSPFALDAPEGMTPFPLEQIYDVFGTAYYECTVDFMLALAAYKLRIGEASWRHVWLPGCDMADGRHYTFRPGAHFWLGVLKGMGIRVSIPRPSMLLKRVVDFPPTPHGDPQFPHCYGQSRESTAPLVAAYGWWQG